MRRRPPAPARDVFFLLLLLLLLLLRVDVAAAQGNDACALARLRALPNLCAPRDTASAATPPEACCDELFALNAAGCFCAEPFLSASAEEQSALVPAIASAPSRCGVNARVGARCEALLVPEEENEEEEEEEEEGEEGEEEEVAAPSPPSPSPPSPSPPPPCAISDLVGLVQDGCGTALAAFAARGGETSAQLASSCCERLRALNDDECFCKSNALNLARTFPANFAAMFAAAPSACGATVVGGWQCAPFPAATPGASLAPDRVLCHTGPHTIASAW